MIMDEVEITAKVVRHEHSQAWPTDAAKVRVVVQGYDAEISFMVSPEIAATHYPLGTDYAVLLRPA